MKNAMHKKLILRSIAGVFVLGSSAVVTYVVVAEPAPVIAAAVIVV